MAGQIPFESLWDDHNFSVQQGVIPAKATLAGDEIGRGIIYYPVEPNVTHHFPGALNVEILLPDAKGKITSVWNPGSTAQIVNHSSQATDFFRVSLKYNPQLISEIPEGEIGPATSLLLHGDWDERFKSSAHADLDAIRRIVPRPGLSYKPSQEDLDLASVAKEDLEFKLGWLSDQARRFKIPLLSLQISGLGTSASTSPPTGLISVTVRTKNPNGGPDVMNCTVWANLGGYGNNTANALSFPNASSPTTDDLCVAIYNIWAEKSGKTGPQKCVRIGRSSSSPNSQSLDVFAP